jgi:hypothetical protein
MGQALAGETLDPVTGDGGGQVVQAPAHQAAEFIDLDPLALGGDHELFSLSGRASAGASAEHC